MSTVYCSWFGRKRKPGKCGGASTADGQDIAVYEEVVRLPAFTRKTLVLLGNAYNRLIYGRGTARRSDISSAVAKPHEKWGLKRTYCSNT